MSDRIFLRGLSAKCIIGFIDWERRTPQTLLIDLEIPCDCTRAARSDQVEDTVDYKRVAKRVLGWLPTTQFHLVETAGAPPGTAAAGGVSARLDARQHQQARRDPRFARCRRATRAPARRISKGGSCRRRRTAGREPGIRRARQQHRSGRAAAAGARDCSKASFPDVRFSSCYRNRARSASRATDFINAVAGFSCTLPVIELLGCLHAIEERCGRGRGAPKWGPREMDLDLLLYGEQVGEGSGYTLPRRDLLRRPTCSGRWPNSRRRCCIRWHGAPSARCGPSFRRPSTS